TNRIIERIGPLILGVRPFTIDGRQRFAFTTATRFRGFQVSNIRTGRVLYTVSFGSNAGLAPGYPPSHGISLSPDERQLWVFDARRNTRKFLEIDWRGGRPVATSSRTGLGRVRR